MAARCRPMAVLVNQPLPEVRLRAVPITQPRLILPSGRALDLGTPVNREARFGWPYSHEGIRVLYRASEKW